MLCHNDEDVHITHRYITIKTQQDKWSKFTTLLPIAYGIKSSGCVYWVIGRRGPFCECIFIISKVEN